MFFVVCFVFLNCVFVGLNCVLGDDGDVDDHENGLGGLDGGKDYEVFAWPGGFDGDHDDNVDDADDGADDDCDDDGDGIVAKCVFASRNLFFEAEY